MYPPLGGELRSASATPEAGELSGHSKRPLIA
jgi:hypothetical protein